MTSFSPRKIILTARIFDSQLQCDDMMVSGPWKLSGRLRYILCSIKYQLYYYTLTFKTQIFHGRCFKWSHCIACHSYFWQICSFFG